jgi:hypothetical protein
VRIALRSTNEGPANPLLQIAPSGTASFLSVLAGATATPSASLFSVGSQNAVHESTSAPQKVTATTATAPRSEGSAQQHAPTVTSTPSAPGASLAAPRAVAPATTRTAARPDAKDDKSQTAHTVLAASVEVPQLGLQNAADESASIAQSIPQKIAATTPDAPQTQGATQEQTAIVASPPSTVSANSTAPYATASSIPSAVSATSTVPPAAGLVAASTEARPDAKDDREPNAPTVLAGSVTGQIQTMPVVPLPTWAAMVGAVTGRPAAAASQPSTAANDQGATLAAAAIEPRATSASAPSAPISAQHIHDSDARPADAASAASAETQTSDAADTVNSASAPNSTSGSAAGAAGFVVVQSAATAVTLAAAMTIPAPGMASGPMGNPISSTQPSAPKTTGTSTVAMSDGASSNGATAGTAKSSSTASSATTQVPAPAPSGQRTQGDASAAATVAAKPVEASASISTAASSGMQHAVATSATTPQAATRLAGEAPHTSELPHSMSGAPEAGESPAVSAINTAKVIQSMGETEMHVGLRSAEFGEISIRTAVSQQQMLAQISVDHSDLGNTIAAHLPAMQAKLGNEYGLHASVEVTQSGTSFTGNGNQSSPQQQKSFAQAVAVEHEASEIDNQSVRASVDGAQRLDIQA